MTRVEEAVFRFREGYNCAEAIASTYGTAFGLDRGAALRVAGGLGGGMGGLGGTCGAVSGAAIVCGLKYGRTRPDDLESKKKTYGLIKEFVKEFKSRDGSIVCRELLGCDVATPEGQKEARVRCPRFVQDSAEILEELLGSTPPPAEAGPAPG